MNTRLVLWVLLLCAVSIELSAQGKHFTSYSGDPVIQKKVSALLSKMTLDEKLGQMSQFAYYGNTVTGTVIDNNLVEHIRKGDVGSILNADDFNVIKYFQNEAVRNSRLGIPILFGLDVIHGFRTIFPIPLAQACSWDTSLIEKCERIAAIESSAAGVNWTFSPMVDISRDPRWGRVMEGAGEDPYLGSQIAKARVKGFQTESIGGTDAVMACVKHFAAYGTVEAGREYNTTDMSMENLYNMFLPPYKAALAANAATLMTAFNELNGIPCTANKYLLTDILRTKWNFKGMVVTDYTAIPEMINHGNVKDENEAAIAALTAGVDMDMQGSVFLNSLKKAYVDKKVTMAQIDLSTSRILELKFMLGLFDNPYRFLDEKRLKNNTERTDYDQVALQAARQSIVLLKNKDNTLPLSRDNEYTIALIGPHAADKTGLNGEWALSANKSQDVSPFISIKEKLDGKLVKVIRAQGCEINGTDTTGYYEARKAAHAADVLVLMMGEDENMSGEAHSRSSILIPDVQRNLMRELKKTGKPLILVLSNGRPLDLSWEDENVDAIIETWFLGRKAGPAIADVLFGDHNPSGKLTMTFPRNLGQVPIYYNHKNTGRPYTQSMAKERYHSVYIDVPNTPLYAFGYGLSYTNFSISNVHLNKKTLNLHDELRVTAQISNTGTIDGENIVQVYVRDLVSLPTRPIKELKAFQKIFLKRGETKLMEFRIPVEGLSYYGEKAELIPPKGDFKLWVANCSDDISNENDFTVQ